VIHPVCPRIWLGLREERRRERREQREQREQRDA